ncbi:hypothetical protein Nepgr_007884 [Nepenthes gracilis]|uniref:Uncharacterized protein n=1 Tax=Nepenthes gracilis TaxID=150966 RepID=A0AAD3XIR4_NEPGR|nr:hypothetical protein Nepgr_007884 [Nepenthes gracilis]
MPHLTGQLQLHETGTPAPKHHSPIRLNKAAKNTTPIPRRANHQLQQQQSPTPDPSQERHPLRMQTQYATTSKSRQQSLQFNAPRTRATAKKSARQNATSPRQHSKQSTQQPKVPNTGKPNYTIGSNHKLSKE